MKKLVMGFGICALAFGLAACGGEEEATQEDPVATDETEAVEPGEEEMGSFIDTSDIPEVIATVNGEDIDKEVYVATIEQEAMQLAMQGIDIDSEEGAVYLEQVKDQVLDRIINSTLIANAANEEGIEVTDEEIESGIADLMAQFGLESEEQLQELLEAQGVPMEELREDVAENVKSNKYIEQKVTEIEVTEEEIQAFYDEAVASAPEAEADFPELEEVREEIEFQLQMDALLANLREESEVTIHV
ncbi:SurA N-terminal domain-containing protein [Alkalihalobacillus sp. MEB130]|uniref:SurA N-terminal domain-containing protein n=1 Tax=Alkalihalobacillus sp. MEB130 TaxID=2976704 RepID=UPI0028E01CE5|nr:SurA N-terminal domain-containing protein [Alkalihalobacillus sp. MEB130]MDT8860592.1 SurA N-terminal domain-containing protein [Alkalihalobacillus sp. MEB130]